MLARGATRSCCSRSAIGIFSPKRRIGGVVTLRGIRASSSSSTSSPSSPSPGDRQPSWLRRDLAIVLVHPQIPQNAGSAARTAAATRVPLHLVGPLGFEIDDKRLKRAGLDYWDSVVLRVWPDWESFEEGVSPISSRSPSTSPSPPSGGGGKALSPRRPRFVAFSKRGDVHYATPGVYGSPTPEDPTYLLFGAETTGLPKEAHSASAAVVRLPIDQREVRSLNLAVSVGVGVYEALRQVDGVGPLPDIGERPIGDASEAALLIVDAQNYNCTRAGALWNSSHSSRGSEDELRYFFSRLHGDDEKGGENPGVIRNLHSLAESARAASCRVAFTVMSSATGEGEGEGVTSVDYELSGFKIPPDSWDAALVDELTSVAGDEREERKPPAVGPPCPRDLFLPKTSCNVFLSTALDFHLRSLRIRKLVVAGVCTDQCVLTAVAHAADLGYEVTLVEDACAATGRDRHEAAVRTLRGFARVRSTREVVAEFDRARKGGG